MWDGYMKKKEALTSNRHGDCTSGGFDVWKGNSCKSDEVCDANPAQFSPLEHRMNEVYLFHGTFIRAALSIA